MVVAYRSMYVPVVIECSVNVSGCVGVNSN